MLSQLYIENIAVIEKARIDFKAGFNVLTGETGAGKSILIDSIHAVLGERTSRELVRTGAKSAFVSAMFDGIGSKAAAGLEELGYPLEEDGTLMLQREIGADTKSSCRINGRPATVSILRQVGPLLINIHGQHESYGLLSPESHIGYLDSTGLPAEQMSEYRSAYDAMRKAKEGFDSCIMDETQKARRMDLLSYQIGELEQANLRAGEEEELNRHRTMYRNSEKIAGSISEAQSALDGNEESPGAVSAVSAAAQALREARTYLPELSDLAERLEGISYELDDCVGELRGYSAQLEYDPAEIDEVESRLDLLYRLGMKYGGNVDRMLEYLEKCRNELEKIRLSDENAEKFREDYKREKKRAEALAAEISRWRRKASSDFSGRVGRELHFLDMPNVTFEVHAEQVPLGSFGCDKVEFYISTNPGEPAKPIAKIASGGELSRIMLAIKTVLAGGDEVGTLIFDEVDSGVSGSAAQKIGLKLREVSENRQVVCVTHLAQIAALADTQYLIEKHVEGGRTFTQVLELGEEGRKQELARIMGGTRITPLMLQNAAEMLEMARKTPRGS
jgi:DNA repair protein RecN (Recombination protein N)